MKKLEAIIRMERVGLVKNALYKSGHASLTLTEVKGEEFRAELLKDIAEQNMW
ncbi:hypothetical protein MMMIC1C10_17530 [Methanococcus maripaludis]|jgi:nitrogen regulatory protein PII|uniref:Nitrogen regulatory protein P-II n=2 Tax=Methanococcus maripaludis TaxID=39152 RepID=A0A2Z5PF01_METMI|nr:hypothetical protein [Methanococcus sp.]BAP60186.1 nitrogen regulatory protein P-II [Methanococcus maripaludis KA1]BAP62179.1 nitrogen regulatory protein P-II [Methanococcus maripaludis OS7]